MVTLTDDERQRFALYLEEDASSSEGLATQADELGPPTALLAKKLRAEALAAKIIAAKLRATETMTT